MKNLFLEVLSLFNRTVFGVPGRESGGQVRCEAFALQSEIKAAACRCCDFTSRQQCKGCPANLIGVVGLRNELVTAHAEEAMCFRRLSQKDPDTWKFQGRG